MNDNNYVFVNTARTFSLLSEEFKVERHLILINHIILCSYNIFK